MIKLINMKNLFSIILLLITTISCRSQNKKTDDYKFFDIDTFEKNKKLISSTRDATDTLKWVNIETYEFKKRDSLIQMEKHTYGDYYKLTRSRIGGSSKIVSIYYPDNYHIKAQYRYFLERPIGIHKTYSNTGELLKETNYDQIRIEHGLPISIFDVAKNMRKDFKINIENENEIIRWEVVKDEDLNKVVYKIICP
ncbi:MAG: hypothetical protein K0R36_2495 [Chryseobacterium sp.]|jgi:hypothetical protein|nr:hypothetical protein [Chryseobacterium sp.]